MNRRQEKPRPRELNRWFHEALKLEFPFLKNWDPATAEDEPQSEITFVVRRGISSRAKLRESDQEGVWLFSQKKQIYSSFEFERTSRPENIRVSHLLSRFPDTAFILVRNTGGRQTRYVLHKRIQETVLELQTQATYAAREMSAMLE